MNQLRIVLLFLCFALGSARAMDDEGELPREEAAAVLAGFALGGSGAVPERVVLPVRQAVPGDADESCEEME